MSDGTQCGDCGAPIDEHALFCGKCGLDVTLVSNDQETMAATAGAGGSPEAPVRSTMRQLLREATLGEYEILHELGRGGMATVFLAHHISLDRKVAIKVMAPQLLEGEGMAERFKLEARTAAQLSHPHIIPIYAVKETASTLYFVMKFVEGKALDQIIRKMGPLPIPMVKDILLKVGGALGYAHRRDVVHRDVKPGNIMIDEEGTPIVTDFGIAKVAETTGLTQTGAAIGTPSYMSPEQCEAKSVTGASDQYGLGIVAFHMLTGKLPFEGDSAVTIMYKHCHAELPPLADFRPDCPPELLDTIERMVAKDPAERWPSLEAAIQQLGAPTTQSYMDPIRHQLVEAAKQGDLELLAQLSTTGQGISSGTGPTTDHGGDGARKRSPMVAAAAVVILAAVGTALAVVQPWATETPAGLVENEDPGADTQTEPRDGAEAAGDDPPQDPAVEDDIGGEAPAVGGGSTTPTTQLATPPERRVVETVRIGGAPESMEPGDAVGLTVTALDPLDARVPESVIIDCGDHGWSRCGYQWTSSDETVARVGDDGQLSAIGPGQVDIGVNVGGVSATETLIVTEASVASVEVEPTSLTLTVGDREMLSAQVRGRARDALSGRPVAWRSDNEDVARVDRDGEVEGRSTGLANVIASSGGEETTVVVTVEAAPVDTRTAIDDLIENYARALESGDIDAVRRAYPGLTDEQEQQLGQALAFMQDLRADLSVESLDDQGDVATAEVTGTYEYVTNGRQEQAPITFRAVFERAADGWRMIQTR